MSFHTARWHPNYRNNDILKRKRFRLGLCLLVVIGAASLSPVRAGLRDNNLIEFSRGSYGNMSVKAMLWPPFVKIYQDGKVIHFESEEKGFYVSRLDGQALDLLKKRLSSEQYLRKSRIIEMEGDDINVHGGVSYIRYLDGDKEILLATEVKPRKGPWVELTDLIWSYVPEDHTQPYYPDLISLHTWEDDSEFSDPNPPLWPFSKQVPLTPKLKTISNPEIIRYLVDRLHGIFSFYVWDFKESDKRYSMALIEVPGWFEQKYINKALAKVRKNGYRETER
jgi:hypothetical protein